MGKCCSEYSCLYSGCMVLSYLTLTAGDKGIKCPSTSPRQCRKGTVRGATVCHDGWLVSIASPPHAPGCTASRHVRREWPQDDTLVDELERRRGVVVCRGKRLAAADVLPRPGACRSPGLAGTRGASQQVSCRALVGLPGKLLLPGSCASSGRPGKLLLPGPWSLRVVFPASSSCRGLVSWLKYFVLGWPKKGPRRVLAVPWQALPRGATTARAQVRGTKVPLF